ncbi:hypothetical protein AB4P97_12020 [Pseudomonas sp. A1230]|uniref:hypothetical protein n=1 Tax=Pseudomonas sp. A1230 TaxID=3235106 RepID=UPI003784F5A6
MSKYAFLDDQFANLSSLVDRVHEHKEQKKYTDRWSRIYIDTFKAGDNNDVYKWDFRIHKSLKEVFTSACFYEESLISKESGSWASFYFLSYYSLFHALMSCVVLLPSESIESLSKITHSKIIKVFKSNFCDQKPHIISPDIDDVFYMLKYMREYYSYYMPTNDFLYNSDDTIKPDEKLIQLIRACSQLAGLHSEIIEKCFYKHGKIHKGILTTTLRNWYGELNCPKHPKTGEHILHFSDQLKISETNLTPEVRSFSILLEHFIDEFRCYEGAQLPKFSNGTSTNPSKLVYNMLR